MKTTRNIKTVFLALFMALFALSGCSKDEEKESLTKTELITKEWKIITVDGETENGVWDSVTMKFDTNGKLTTKTDQAGFIVTYFGTWSWGPKEVTIKILKSGLNEQEIWTLDKLTADALWVYDAKESFIKLEINK